MSKHNNNAGAGKNVKASFNASANASASASVNMSATAGEEEDQAENQQNRTANEGEKPSAEKAESGTAPAAEKEKTPEEKIAELEAKAAEANDLYLRKAADFENFRKRMNKEKQEAIEYANQSLLLDLIETLDDFERALKSAESTASGEFKAFYDGFAMIEKRLSSQLESKWGLKRHVSAGKPFDPNCHEAIMMEKSAETDEPVVQDEFLKCFTLKDRVIRSAKVKVLMPAKNSPAGSQDGPEKKQGEEAKPEGENS